MPCCGNRANNNGVLAEERNCLRNDIASDSTVFYTPSRNNEKLRPIGGCCGAHNCTPIPVRPLCAREYRLCTDQNGCSARYPVDCRNLFWPSFCHPRWLPCNCLYCNHRQNRDRSRVDSCGNPRNCGCGNQRPLRNPFGF